MDEKALYKSGYDGAVKMITYEGALIWSVFRTTLSANAILLVFSGVILNQFQTEKLFVVPAAALGIALEIGWLLFAIRQRCYYKYWLSWAKHYEKLLFNADAMFQGGEIFAEGRSVKISQNEDGQFIVWPARHANAFVIALPVIFAFLVYYIALLHKVLYY